MVTIRLARHGAKKSPFYHVTVAEKSAKRDGRFIERIGFYNPIARGADVPLRIDLARFDHWLANGAQPTERVRHLAAEVRRMPAAAMQPAPVAVPSGAEAEAPQGPAEPGGGEDSTAVAEPASEADAAATEPTATADDADATVEDVDASDEEAPAAESG